MKKKYYLSIGIFILTVSLAILIFVFREEIAKLEEYGYLGAFSAALLTNATVLVPVPGALIIVALGTIFNPWLIGLLAGLGATIGQTTGYFFGYSGQVTLEEKKSIKYQKMIRWMQRWGALTIFLFAIIPNPIADIPGAVAGILKFPFLKFIFFCALGNIPKNILFALFGAWGLEFLLFF